MKLITPLWSDPIGWADWIAKTKVRVVVWIYIHLAFITAGFFGILREVNKAQSSGGEIGLSTILAGSFPIVFIGFAYPCLYMIAMYKLLKIIREEKDLHQDKSYSARQPSQTKVEPDASGQRR